jgi:hypothetical protein
MDSTKEIHRKAEQFIQNLDRELQKTIQACKKETPEYDSWLNKFFLPAQKGLREETATPIRKLANACENLNVWGGMCSWSDVGIGNRNELYIAFAAANIFYQESWENGLK